MVSTTWQYRQSDIVVAQREAEREISDFRDAQHELSGVTRRVAEDVGLSFSSREYTFFVRTGVAGTVDDPLLVGFVSAISTANVGADTYTIDAPGRTGWELTQAGALQYVGAALSGDTAAFTLDITATLGADLEAHAKVNVIAENLSPFRIRSSDPWRFPTLLDHTSPNPSDTGVYLTRPVEHYSSSSQIPAAGGNFLGRDLFYPRPSPPYSAGSGVWVQSWSTGDRGVCIPLGDKFISDDTNATYTYGAECSVPSVVETMVIRNPNILARHQRGSYRRTNTAFMVTMLLLNPRMRGNASVSVYAIDAEGDISGGFTFNYQSYTHPDAATIGADDFQARPYLLRPFPPRVRLPINQTTSIPLGNYFSMSRYGIPPVSVLWNTTMYGTTYPANRDAALLEGYWYRPGYNPRIRRASDSQSQAAVWREREQNDSTELTGFATYNNISMQVTETGLLNIRTGATAAGNYIVSAALTANTIGESYRWTPTQSFALEIITGLGFSQDRYDFTLEAGETGTPTPVELGSVSAWGNNVNYRLTAGDATKFAVASNTGAVTYIGSGETLDERDIEFRLEITAQQGTNISDTDTAEAIVTVVGTLEAPIRFGQDTYQFFIQEDTAGPYREQWAVAALSTDLAATPTIRYSSSDASLISVAANGDITYEGDSLDAGETATVTITAATGSGQLQQTATATVVIVAIATNRATPIITFSNTPYVFSLLENTPGIAAAPLGTITASVVGDRGAQIRYGIETAYAGVPFSIDPVSGVMRYTGDGEVYDRRRVYPFQVVATTASTATALAGRQAVFVKVNITRNAAVPDNPVFSQDDYTFTAPSGTAGSTIPIPIGYTPAAGADVGYRLLPPASETAADWSISASALISYSGAAKTAGTTVELTVIAETNSSNADVTQRGSASAVVTVTFTAGTQPLQTITWPAASFTDGRYEFSVEENTATPHTLATILPTVAAPAGSTAGALTLTRGGLDSDRFTWSDTGMLAVTGTLDFDAKEVYTLLLTATAAATSTARETTSHRWVQLTLTEDDDDTLTAPSFSAASYAFDLTAGVDGSAVPEQLGQISAAAPEGTIGYTITAGDVAKFAVNITTGELTYIGTGETAGAAYAVTITATTRDGSRAAAASVVARITVVERAKADVTITSPDAPEAIFTIPADTDGTTTAVYVGTVPFVASSSAGLAAIGRWNFTIPASTNLEARVSGNHALIYYVGPAVAAGTNPIDTILTASISETTRTHRATYELRLLATFAQEMPVFAQSAYEFSLSSSAEGSVTPVSVGTVTARRAESYALVLGDSTRFAVNSSTGEITYISSASRLSATDSYTLQITATNGSVSATVNVLVSVKSPVTVSFTPAAPVWVMPENTPGPVTLGSLTVNTLAADINGLPSAPSLVAGGADGALIGIVATAHNVFTISYTGGVRTTALSFTLTASCAENGTALEADSVLTLGVPLGPATPILDAASYTYELPDGTDPPPVYALGTPAITNASGYTQRWRIITQQTGQRLFAIDAATGAITYDGPAAADRDDTPSYTLQIGVVNQEGGKQSAEATSTVTVNVGVTYVAPVKNDSWTPGAGWTKAADGSWHRTMTNSQVVAVDIEVGATGPYSIQSGLTANYRNTTVPSPPTDFTITRSDSVFTITASATQTGSETLYLYINDGRTSVRLDFHIQVVASANTQTTEVVWYQDSGAGYAVIGSEGITIGFPEGQAAQVATNIYAAYTQITNRTNASLDEPTQTGFDIITQTSPRRQIQVGSQMIWIDAYTINVEPSQFDFESQSRFDIVATLNVPEYTAGSVTYAAAHKPLDIHLRVSDVNEPPARTSLAAPADFGLRKQGAVVQFSLAGFWLDPEGRTLSYRLTQRVVGATGAQSTTPSDYLSASIIGSDFQASAGQTSLVTPTGVTIEFSVEAYDGTQYSTPMTFSCDEVHGRALEDSPLAWQAMLPARLVWQVAENVTVPLLLRNDIYAASTVTDQTATAGAIQYTLQEAQYWPVRDTDYTFTDNAPSLASGGTLEIDFTTAFEIAGPQRAGKDFTLTATTTDSAILTATVAGKKVTLTGSSSRTSLSNATFTVTAHAGGFTEQYVGVASVAAAISATLTVKTAFTKPADVLGVGTDASPFERPRGGSVTFTAANFFDSSHTPQIYEISMKFGFATPWEEFFPSDAFTLTADASGNSAQRTVHGKTVQIVNWGLQVTLSGGADMQMVIKGRVDVSHTTTAEATVYWV